MKTSIAKLALGLTLVTMSSIAMAGISDTKHNLGKSTNNGRDGGVTSTWGWNFTYATTEICVFCHTPHGSDSSAAVPLWNRALGTPTDYQTYSSLGTSTMDAASAQIGGVSLACLSCHDGTQALNSVLNTPGSGTSGDMNLKSDGITKIIADGVVVTQPGRLCYAAPSGNCGGYTEFGIMSDVPNEPIYLAQDLRNDHPVSIQYAGATTGTALDLDFKAATQATNGTWYVETNSGTAGAKDKYDFPLYTRTAGDKGTGLTGQPLVECATCHDPHTSEGTTFLRMKRVGGTTVNGVQIGGNSNDASRVCLACHTK